MTSTGGTLPEMSTLSPMTWRASARLSQLSRLKEVTPMSIRSSQMPLVWPQMWTVGAFPTILVISSNRRFR